MKKRLTILFVIPIVFAFSISHGDEANKLIPIKPVFIVRTLSTDILRYIISSNLDIKTDTDTDTDTTLNDGDLDGIDDELDNCIDVVNPDQLDGDKDGIGDECDDVVNKKTDNNIVTDTNISLADNGGDCSLNPSATANVGWLVDMLLFSIPLAFIGKKRK